MVIMFSLLQLWSSTSAESDQRKAEEQISRI